VDGLKITWVMMMSIEAIKQALEALEINLVFLRNVKPFKGQENLASDCVAMTEETITSLRQAIAEAEDNYQGSDAAKAAHMMDLYTALGVKWGEDPFAVIAKMRSIAEAKKQEPVALETVYETIIHWDEGGGKRSRRELARRIEALYTHPQPKREWVGLTVDEMAICIDEPAWDLVLRKAEQILKEKNT
jgi:hypothetical protein